MASPNPPDRCPGAQALLIAVHRQDWDLLRTWHARENLLLDLWDPSQLHDAHPIRQARINRLEATSTLFDLGIVDAPSASRALGELLDWGVDEAPDAAERATWVRAFAAMKAAGVALATTPIPDFDKWFMEDPWARLAHNSHLSQVLVALIDADVLDPFIPAQPQWPAWPPDPTRAFVEKMGTGTEYATWLWIKAMDNGYEVKGPAGLEWLAHAAGWDNGQAISRALQGGGVDVRALARGKKTLLEVWLDQNALTLSPVCVLALLRHDPGVLGLRTAMDRPLYGVLMESLANYDRQMQELGLDPEPASAAAADLARAWRASADMDVSLPAARSSAPPAPRL